MKKIMKRNKQRSLMNLKRLKLKKSKKKNLYLNPKNQVNLLNNQKDYLVYSPMQSTLMNLNKVTNLKWMNLKL